MAIHIVAQKLEIFLIVGLLAGAAACFTIWHEPGCGILLAYFAIRTGFYGLIN